MSRPKFSELQGFVAIATHLSFQKAAVDLGVSASALSHGLRQLEDRLNIRLLNRTTRSVALTEAGKRLFLRLQPAFHDIAGAVEDLNALRQAPVGAVRINAPRQAVRLGLIPMVDRFLAAYPGVTLDIVADDTLTDMVAEGFDAGVRFGNILAQDMIAVPFGPPQRFAVVASPEYFKHRPRPETPGDLTSHVCIRYRLPGRRIYKWEFAKDGADIEVEVNGALIFDDTDLVMAAAVAGLGLAYVFERQALPLIRAERLERTLESWCARCQNFFLYYPSRRNPSFAFRAFIDFLKEAKPES